MDDEALYALARGQLPEAELQHVEAHLKDCSDCRAVLAEAARSLEVVGSTAGALDEQGPRRIDRYEVVSLLGAGASGVVYRGFDSQLKRAVALKLLRPESHGTSPVQSERLLREAQAMARLSDPHVVAVYDVGLHQGMVYLVMEYVDGHTLGAWLREEPRSIEQIIQVFIDAGRGLAAAHHKGLVHRDFKPENVLVSRDGRARVTDFGLARESEAWLQERQADDQASTELYAPTRGLAGTPAYMAPELFEGGRASPASDQFAFSVALFVALFEKHPFKAGEGIALSELITRVRAGTLATPAFARPNSQRLFPVLERGLAPLPSSRFSSMQELLSALERAAVGPRRRGIWLAALVGVLIVLALVSARWFSRGASTPAVPQVSRSASAEPSGLVPAMVVPLAARSSPEPARPLPSGRGPALARPSSSAPMSALSEKRRAPKPSDVRYKDWLKEPF